MLSGRQQLKVTDVARFMPDFVVATASNSATADRPEQEASDSVPNLEQMMSAFMLSLHVLGSAFGCKICCGQKSGMKLPPSGGFAARKCVAL